MQRWDAANKASELSDFSVCTSWGIKGNDLYLLHVLRRRMEYPELKLAVREQRDALASVIAKIMTMETRVYEVGWSYCVRTPSATPHPPEGWG